jgi:hypothetical protein
MIARRLAQGRTPELRGVSLPRDAQVLRMRGRARSDLVLGAVLETPRQDFVGISFGKLDPAGRVLAARVPAGAGGGRLVQLSIEQIGFAAETGEELRGVLELGPLVARSAGRTVALTDFRHWQGLGGATVEADGGRGTRIRYSITQATATRLRPSQPPAEPVPALVSPDVARVAGRDRLVAVMVGDAEIRVRAVAVARLFPTVGPDSGFVVADRAKLFAVANQADPGSATRSEIWLRARSLRDASGLARELRRPPFSLLTVRSRLALERDLRSDALARGTFLLLAGGATLALVVGALGLLLFALLELRDERGELFDLEAQGMAPRSLRRHLGLRTLVVVAFGSAGGAVAGIALTSLVVRLVALSAEATTSVPPLLAVLAWPFVLMAVAGAVLTAGLVIAATTRAAFRASVAGRHP